MAPPADVEARLLRAQQLLAGQRWSEVAEICRQLLAESTDCTEARFLLGAVLLRLGQPEAALGHLEGALRLAPLVAEGHYNRANALRDLGRLPEALEGYERALALQPPLPEAANNLGAVLQRLGRLEEALAGFDRALRLRPGYVAALNNRGRALRELHRSEEALATLERALGLAPGHVGAWINRGNALRDLGRHAEAIASFDKALELAPGFPEALNNRGSALLALKSPAEAADAFRRLLGVAPEFPYAAGNLLEAGQLGCDWENRADLLGAVLAGVDAGRGGTTPLSFLHVSADARQQQLCARAHAGTQLPPVQVASPIAPVRAQRACRLLRVAYVSADFREHALARLMAGVFERHDRRRFEILGVSLAPTAADPMGRRLEGVFDAWIEATQWSDAELVRVLHEREVDIAVDLMGYTLGARPGVFARRAAPVQASYLGYPGTMGTPCIDYILADDYVIPPASRPYYTEQVVYLPHCFQANDDRRIAVGRPPARQDYGLPEQGVVLCCFNASEKYTPEVFGVWMRLLRETRGSVLWLVVGTALTRANLIREAARYAVDADRLVFAARAPYAEHLRRLACADLFLDSYPFNAGATASDALWAGVPILTCSGAAFASRMAGSLLRAAGLPELVTQSLREYEALGLELTAAPERLRELRERLRQSGGRRELFDTARACTALERAYLAMWERAARSEPPQSFGV